MATGKALSFLSKMAVPAAIGISLVQASLYDVKGGNRAVIFDRLAGVKETVPFPNLPPPNPMLTFIRP